MVTHVTDRVTEWVKNQQIHRGASTLEIMAANLSLKTGDSGSKKPILFREFRI